MLIGLLGGVGVGEFGGSPHLRIEMWGTRFCGWLRGGHELERGLLEGEWAGVVEELLKEGGGVERDVVGGGEDAGVTGDATHAAGGGVVDGAAEEVVEVGVEFGVCFGFVVVGFGGDAGEQ